MLFTTVYISLFHIASDPVYQEPGDLCGEDAVHAHICHIVDRCLATRWHHSLGAPPPSLGAISLLSMYISHFYTSFCISIHFIRSIHIYNDLQLFLIEEVHFSQDLCPVTYPATRWQCVL